MWFFSTPTLTCCSAAAASRSRGPACWQQARWRGPAGQPTQGKCSFCRTPGPVGSSGAHSRTGIGRYHSSSDTCPWSSWTCCQSAPWRHSNPWGTKHKTEIWTFVINVFHHRKTHSTKFWNLECIKIKSNKSYKIVGKIVNNRSHE